MVLNCHYSRGFVFLFHPSTKCVLKAIKNVCVCVCCRWPVWSSGARLSFSTACPESSSLNNQSPLSSASMATTGASVMPRYRQATQYQSTLICFHCSPLKPSNVGLNCGALQVCVWSSLLEARQVAYYEWFWSKRASVRAGINVQLAPDKETVPLLTFT